MQHFILTVHNTPRTNNTGDTLAGVLDGVLHVGVQERQAHYTPFSTSALNSPCVVVSEAGHGVEVAVRTPSSTCSRRSAAPVQLQIPSVLVGRRRRVDV